MLFRRFGLVVLACGLLVAGVGRTAAQSLAPQQTTCDIWSVDDLLASPTPFAVGHRGFGENAGVDPSRPIENTLDAFRHGFVAGVRETIKIIRMSQRED